MSITSELLNAVGLDDLPASVKQALEREVEGRLLAVYGREIKKLQPFLYKQGADVGRKIAAGILGAIIVDPKTVEREVKAKKMPEWVTRIIMPAIIPFLDGVKSTAMPTVKRVAVGIGAALVGAGLVGGFALSRALAPKRLPGP